MASSNRRRPKQQRRKGPTPRNQDRSRVDTAGSPPPPTARYTPPVKNRGLFRPMWHKVVGGLLILGGITLFVLNDLEWFDVHVMPGGHNELYALLAFGIAGSSTWWFGWFDRPPQRH